MDQRRGPLGREPCRRACRRVSAAPQPRGTPHRQRVRRAISRARRWQILDLFPALELIEGLKPTAGRSRRQLGRRRRSVRSGRNRRSRRAAGRLHAAARARPWGHGNRLRGRARVAQEPDGAQGHAPAFRADGAYVRRFETEARSAARLHHTNIVPVFDYGEQDGVCYYAMQLIIGVGLEQVLEDVRRLRSSASTNVGPDPGSPGQATVDRRATNPLRAVSHGLMTGRFTTPRQPPRSSPGRLRRRSG